MDLTYWQHNLVTFRFRDVVDIALVWLFLYYFFLLIRGTRAVQILQGVGVLLVISLVAYYFELATIYWLLRALLISIAVALPIVFHPELRRALGTIGRSGVKVHGFSRVAREDMARVIEQVCAAVDVLALSNKGALIVMERETGLQEWVESGVELNADVSKDLLISIFWPPNPLHDGAVIIHGDKIVAAACFLPMSDNIPIEGLQLGTRHRAAIGLSEQTDSLVVVVSEQTGAISTAIDGKLSRGYNHDTLKRALINGLVPPSQPLSGAGSLLKLPPWR